MTEIVDVACGVIAIGPFGCMPNRLSESILSDIMNPEDKLASEPHNRKLRAALENVEDLPRMLGDIVADGDIVVTMGAGNIGLVAANMAEAMCS